MRLDRRPGSRTVAAALLAACLGALAAAFAGEHLLGLQPCILCLYERVPYAVAAVMALVAVAVPMTGSRRRRLILVAGVVLLANALLAFYHVGVEEHWWAGIPGCEGGLLPPDLTVEELQARLAGPQPKPCDEVDWRLFGVSLAGYNALAALALGVACLAFAGPGRERDDR